MSTILGNPITLGGGKSFPNGTKWTQSNITSGTFYGLCYANGIWVAGSNNKGLYYSTDGKTWVQSSITTNEISRIN